MGLRILMKSRIHIGTSGWHYSHWRGLFYPRDLSTGKFLDFYRHRLKAVEINNSFYQLPSRATLGKWRRAVANDFVFAVKASRYITHVKKLKDPSQGINRFLKRVGALKEKLGPILFQLPPSWKPNPVRLKDFLDVLPEKYQYTFEFRNREWINKEICDLIRRYHCAFCIYDIDGYESPVKMTADFVYLRLHGPGRAYQGCYHGQTLRKWSRKISEWIKMKKQVYCFFDNDQSAYAVQNALTLKKMLRV